MRWNYAGAYFQADFKFSWKLTLNLGVRWDLLTHGIMGGTSLGILYGPEFTKPRSREPAWHHSFQLFAQKHMGHDFEFISAYTFSKAIDNTRGYGSGVGQQNYDNRAAERSLSAVDQPQILTISLMDSCGRT